MSFDSLLVNTCSVLRRASGGEDDSGHNLASYQAIHTGIACRIYQSTGNEEKVEDELTVAKSTVSMRPISVIEQDYLLINSRAYNVLHVYEVRALANTPHHLQLEVEELKTWPTGTFS